VLRLPRLHQEPGHPGPRRAGRTLWISALALAAGSLAGAMTSAVPASAATVPAGSSGNSTASVGSIKDLPLSYLRAQAKYHYMGYSLPRHQASSVTRSAVPLLATAADPVYGLDVSSFQGSVNWSAVKSDGAGFAYVKATEGTYYTNPDFSQQYVGSFDVGLVRGAYAFAIPNFSSGASQADYLASHGGAWSADGKTLPGALDIEYDPYVSSDGTNECYGLSQASMRSWINAFLNEYHARTTRWAVIYSTFDWWNTCTGNWSGPAANDPFWIARYASSVGTLPAGVPFYTFWQFADSGTFPGDQDVFNGSTTNLVNLANNT
jgi:GH25 family lysozyme M1 (1,4-beta-N-acetylmuramidase)